MSFASSSFEADVLSINGTGMSRAVLDASHMGTTGDMEKIFGDLRDAGALDIECAFDAQHAAGMQTSMVAVADTITITMPDGITAVGTGAVTAWDYALPFEERMTQSFTWTWDGKTGPTYS